MKRIYIAHPLAGKWPERNVEKYLECCADATKDGHVVLSWIVNYLMHVRYLTNGDEHYYIERDFKLIDVADEVWLCGAWWDSNGCKREREYAEKIGVPVVEKTHEVSF
jgi:hypothetical protein